MILPKVDLLLNESVYDDEKSKTSTTGDQIIPFISSSVTPQIKKEIDYESIKLEQERLR